MGVLQPDRRLEVAFIGVGAMGGSMADNVARAGYAPRVHDVDPERVAARLVSGAVGARSAVDAARGADVVCVVVHDDEQVLDVVDEPVLKVMAPDAIVVLHSTVTLATVATVRARCESAGRHLVDMGISGGVTGAEAGSLLLIAGGDSEVIEQIRPVVGCYSRALVACGASGAGMAAKAARNLIALCVMAATADAAALARAAGVDPRVFAEIVRETAPTAHVQRLLDGSMLAESGNTVSGIATTGAKDLGVAVRMAAELGVVVPSATTAIDQWDRVVSLVEGDAD